jgi:hypothetical protein
MSLSDYERRRWRELEAELSRQRRPAALARRLEVMPSYSVMLWWDIGGALGLALVTAGAAVHSGSVLAAGVSILTTTLVLTGIALIATGVCDVRR